MRLLHDLGCAPGDLLFRFSSEKTAGSPRRKPKSLRSVFCRGGAGYDSVKKGRLCKLPPHSSQNRPILFFNSFRKWEVRRCIAVADCLNHFADERFVVRQQAPFHLAA